ncbi:MAG: MMPL family transporter, partial [Nanoarchaeota archaeon]
PPTCQETSKGWVCSGSISLTVSNKAAERFANITSNLAIIGSKLNETIDFYLDNKLITNLTIAASLKGVPAKNIEINLVGTGKTKEEAMTNLEKEIKIIKGLLESGSIPIKFKIVKTNKFESKLGKDFLQNAILIGAISIVLIALIIYLKYPYLPLFFAIMLSMASEVLMILAFASLIHWQLDLASLAGILVSVGTGVDDLIVMTDQILRRHHKFERRIKEAYTLILFSWITTVLAMLPLLFSEFIFLRGFALTTIIGVTIGVFITRPVFKEILTYLAYKLEKKRQTN